MTSKSRYFTRKQFSERKNRETEDEESRRKIYVGGLHDQTIKSTVKNYFKQFGIVLKCEIKKRYGNREAYGFVTFKDTSMVDDTQNNRPHEIDGKIVVTRRCVPQKNVEKLEEFMQVNKLFVGALREYIWEIDLREYFSEYGTIVNVNIVRGEKGHFSIIEFDDYDPVDKIQFGTHFIKGHQVEVKKAMTKEEMKIAERKERGTLKTQWPSGTHNFIDRRRSFQRKALKPKIAVVGDGDYHFDIHCMLRSISLDLCRKLSSFV